MMSFRDISSTRYRRRTSAFNCDHSASVGLDIVFIRLDDTQKNNDTNSCLREWVLVWWPTRRERLQWRCGFLLIYMAVEWWSWWLVVARIRNACQQFLPSTYTTQCDLLHPEPELPHLTLLHRWAGRWLPFSSIFWCDAGNQYLKARRYAVRQRRKPLALSIVMHLQAGHGAYAPLANSSAQCNFGRISGIDLTHGSLSVPFLFGGSRTHRDLRLSNNS